MCNGMQFPNIHNQPSWWVGIIPLFLSTMLLHTVQGFTFIACNMTHLAGVVHLSSSFQVICDECKWALSKARRSRTPVIQPLVNQQAQVLHPRDSPVAARHLANEMAAVLHLL